MHLVRTFRELEPLTGHSVWPDGLARSTLEVDFAIAYRELTALNDAGVQQPNLGAIRAITAKREFGPSRPERSQPNVRPCAASDMSARQCPVAVLTIGGDAD